MWYAIPIIGIVYLIYSHRFFLPGWLLLVGVITGELRFIFTIGSLVTTVFVLDGVIPWITQQLQLSLSRQHALTAVLLILAILGGNIMTLYASGAVTDYGGSNSMPSFVDEQDYAAMQWTQRNINQSSEFIVIGDAAEWFPYLANRTNVVGPWG
ncbi:hypothetical protein BG842_00525 [Haladaptatus sp. W1]|nr:hypothetical protein BG842_00525 [Haladaptatus sp. W1]